MKRALTLAFLFPILTSAQQFGTKRDALAAAGGNSGASMMPLVQMLLALAIVFGLLKFALPKVASRLNKKLVTGVNGSIRIEESANFAGGSLYIVSARDRTLLLSVGTSGVNCVADLTPADKPSEAPLFSDYLAIAADPQVANGVNTAVPEIIEAGLDERRDPSPEEVRRALDRLGRLTANV